LQTMPLLDGIDVAKLTGTQAADRISLQLTATGPDAKRVRATVESADAVIKESLPDLEKLAGFMPPLRPLRDLLKSVRLTPTEGNLTGTAAWNGSLTTLYVFAMYPYTLPADVPPAP
jgi:hypothetical protein